MQPYSGDCEKENGEPYQLGQFLDCAVAGSEVRRLRVLDDYGGLQLSDIFAIGNVDLDLVLLHHLPTAKLFYVGFHLLYHPWIELIAPGRWRRVGACSVHKLSNVQNVQVRGVCSSTEGLHSLFGQWCRAWKADSEHTGGELGTSLPSQGLYVLLDCCAIELQTAYQMAAKPS